MPALNGFMGQYPNVELEVDLTDRMADAIKGGFDVVWLALEPAWPAL
jgi:DNA-binding transcriptional LysR family regulator